MNKERQSKVASTLNAMGWIAIDPDTDEMLEAIYVGKPIVMRLRHGANRIIVNEHGIVRDFEPVS